MFADDTYLIVEDKNINDLHKKIMTEIISLNKCMTANIYLFILLTDSKGSVQRYRGINTTTH